MRLPISLGLDWPHRVAGVGVPLDWTTASRWEFEPLDEEAFPAVALAKRVGRRRRRPTPRCSTRRTSRRCTPSTTARSGYLDILDTVRAVVDRHEAQPMTLEGVLEAERWARAEADALIASGALGP